MDDLSHEKIKIITAEKRKRSHKKNNKRVVCESQQQAKYFDRYAHPKMIYIQFASSQSYTCTRNRL